MNTVVQAEIVIPESMGKAEALAKVCASLQRLIAERCRFWRTERGRVAVLGPRIGRRAACRVYAYRLARDARGNAAALREEVWSRKAERVTL